MESLFRKTICSQGCHCPKKDNHRRFPVNIWRIPVNSICLCKYVLSFLLFCFRTTEIICESSNRRSSVKKSVLKNFANFTAKHVLESLFIKVACLL